LILNLLVGSKIRGNASIPFDFYLQNPDLFPYYFTPQTGKNEPAFFFVNFNFGLKNSLA